MAWVSWNTLCVVYFAGEGSSRWSRLCIIIEIICGVKWCREKEGNHIQFQQSQNLPHFSQERSRAFLTTRVWIYEIEASLVIDFRGLCSPNELIVCSFSPLRIHFGRKIGLIGHGFAKARKENRNMAWSSSTCSSLRLQIFESCLEDENALSLVWTGTTQNY